MARQRGGQGGDVVTCLPAFYHFNFEQYNVSRLEMKRDWALFLQVFPIYILLFGY
jgi:hypothetical protein